MLFSPVLVPNWLNDWQRLWGCIHKDPATRSVTRIISILHLTYVNGKYTPRMGGKHGTVLYFNFQSPRGGRNVSLGWVGGALTEWLSDWLVWWNIWYAIIKLVVVVLLTDWLIGLNHVGRWHRFYFMNTVGFGVCLSFNSHLQRICFSNSLKSTRHPRIGS